MEATTFGETMGLLEITVKNSFTFLKIISSLFAALMSLWSDKKICRCTVPLKDENLFIRLTLKAIFVSLTFSLELAQPRVILKTICSLDKNLSCLSPNLPNEKFVIKQRNSVSNGASLQLKCKRGFNVNNGELDGTILTCYNGQWRGKIPTCESAYWFLTLICFIM